jgi:hypothetical protein
MKAVMCFAIVAAVLAAAVVSATGDFGSYIVTCTETNVTFQNWPTQNCQGAPSGNSSGALNQCGREFHFLSWNAQCNATNMWYSNFLDEHCTGKSELTRWYTTNACFNCLNKECKNP